MKNKYGVRVICCGKENPFKLIIKCEDSKEIVKRKIKSSYASAFNLKEEDIEVLVSKYEESVINENI